MIGQRLSHYTILDRRGKGGMGEMFEVPGEVDPEAFAALAPLMIDGPSYDPDEWFTGKESFSA